MMNKSNFDEAEWLRRKNLWKFSLRLLGLLIITMFLIFDLISTIDYPDDFIIAQVSKATERLGIYYAYFTTQTNYLVVIYLGIYPLTYVVGMKFNYLQIFLLKHWNKTIFMVLMS